jgi:hypothetical protein
MNYLKFYWRYKWKYELEDYTGAVLKQQPKVKAMKEKLLHAPIVKQK